MKTVILALVITVGCAAASAGESLVEILDRNGNVCHYKVTNTETGQVTYFYAPCPED